MDSAVGILSTSPVASRYIREQVSTAGGAVTVEVDEYCASKGDRSTRRFLAAKPEMILISVEDLQPALQSLEVLQSVLPDSWLCVTTDLNDPEVMLEMMRAGAHEFLPKPMTSSAFAQAHARYVTAKQRRQVKPSRGKIYGVTAAKGGAGATSVAINLAACIASTPDTEVALIDLNSPVGDAAAYLNLKPQFTVSDALAAVSRLDVVMLESLMSRSHGFAVLPSPKDAASGELPSMELEGLAALLEVVTEKYTHTIIDFPASLNGQYLKVISDLSSAMLVVLTPEFPALWRTTRLMQLLSRCGTDHLRLVVNRSNGSDEISSSEIEKLLNHGLFWRLPNNYAASIQAINAGKPLVSLNHSKLGRSFQELAHQLAGVPLSGKGAWPFRLFS